MKLTSLLVLVAIVATPALAFHPNEQCDRCHVPHMAVSGTNMPLWNGEQTPTITSWTTYIDGATLGSKMDATDVVDPAGQTLLCLSCHDRSDGSRHNINAIAGDLAGTHPMDFVYDTALSTLDGELKDPSTTLSNVVGSSKFIKDDLLTADGRVSCISCHDVHVQGLHESGVLYVGTIYDGDDPELVEVQAVEADGVTLIFEDGDQIFEQVPLMEVDGVTPILDADDNPIMVDGDPVYEADGVTPTYEQVPVMTNVPVYEADGVTPTYVQIPVMVDGPVQIFELVGVFEADGVTPVIDPETGLQEMEYGDVPVLDGAGDPTYEQIQQVDGAGDPVFVNGDPIYEIAVNNIEMDFPHLQNIDGVRYKIGRGGSPDDESDYELAYGDICTTCHIK